ncbi:MAG: hypothetical protein ACR2RV_23455 [Verrucomicrobiales bacterium]
MYRIFIVKRRGGQFQLEISQNVLGSVKMMNRRLEQQGKKPWDFWKLVWFSKPDKMRPTKNRMQRLLRCGGWTAMQSLLSEFADEESKDFDREKIAEV